MINDFSMGPDKINNPIFETGMNEREKIEIQLKMLLISAAKITTYQKWRKSSAALPFRRRFELN